MAKKLGLYVLLMFILFAVILPTFLGLGVWALMADQWIIYSIGLVIVLLAFMKPSKLPS